MIDGSLMTYGVIPAAGRGERFGGKVKKQFLALCGRPVIVHTLIPFQASPWIDDIVCVAPQEEVGALERLISEYRLTKVKRVISGGERRQESTQAALSLLEKEAAPGDIVLVHDGVRPLVTGALIGRVVQAAEKYGAAVAAFPVSDSLKEVSSEGLIRKTVSRENLWATQTPQAFRLDILAEAYRTAARDRFIGTDEAALVERLGIPIHCVEGSPENIKITTPSDLKLVELLLHDRMEKGDS